MTDDGSSALKNHAVVSRKEWLSARTAFLKKEKEFTRLWDDLSRQRRELPWVKVEKPYVFNGPKGKETLAGLFENRSQLIVYHFMFAPEWDAGCPHCSRWADNFNSVETRLAVGRIGCAAMMNTNEGDCFQRAKCQSRIARYKRQFRGD